MSLKEEKPMDRRSYNLWPGGRRKWLYLVWVLLIAKSIILSSMIVRYDVPVSHLIIWGPSLIGAAIITYFILKPQV